MVLNRKVQLTSISLLLCRGTQLCPPWNKLQQSFNLIILKQISPSTTGWRSAVGAEGSHRSRTQPDSQVMIGRKRRSFCLQPGLPPLCCRRLLRVLHVGHVAQLLLLGTSQKAQPPSSNSGKTKKGRKRTLQSHLQPCKHSGPLVAKAVRLQGAQLLL